MNLPVILDIAIGLVFIFLIASLLASEIQELLAALLQWRAKHLKESIQNLLSGGYGTQDSDRITGFVDAIYNDPLIKNNNQSSRGLIGRLGQTAYQIFYGNNKIFGTGRSGPSYISSETFATTLLEQVGMASLIEKLTEIRLEKFIGRIVGLYTVEETADLDGGTIKRTIMIPSAQEFEQRDNWEKGGIRVLAEKAKALAQGAQTTSETTTAILTLDHTNPDFMALVEEYDDLLMDFKAGQVNVQTCVERMQEGLELFINQVGERIPTEDPQATATSSATRQQDFEKKQLDYFQKRLKALNLSTFGEDSTRAISSGKLRPNLLEVAEVFDRSSMTYEEIERAFRDAKAAYEAGMKPETIQPVLAAIAAQVNERVRTRTTADGSGTAVDAFAIYQPIAIPDLLTDQYQSEVEEVLKTLTPKEQEIYRQTYRGWKQYQQIILKVTQDLADQLQNKPSSLNSNELGRLFNLKDQLLLAKLPQDENRIAPRERDKYVVKRWQDLDPRTLTAYVKHSLSKLFDEERQLCINTALNNLPLEQQRIYKNYQTYDQIQDFLGRVPAPVKQSLAILARRAYVKAQETDKQLNQFKQEVSVWFDRSMSRASGVYKRNAKLVAIVIGILIALIANADTFHIVSRLSGDESLRQVITQKAGEVTQSIPANTQGFDADRLRQLKDQTGSVLQEVALPVQWTPTNLRQQFGCGIATSGNSVTAAPGTIAPSATVPSPATSPVPVVSPTTPSGNPPGVSVPQASPASSGPMVGTSPAAQTAVINPNSGEWERFYRACLPGETSYPKSFDANLFSKVALRNPLDIGRIALGWFISGLAIAMGAPFWFDLLSKIMNVRNTGGRPASTTDKQNSNPPT